MNRTEPPRATPVSMMTSGFVAQMTSWVAMMSAGNWMIGTHPAPEICVVVFIGCLECAQCGVEYLKVLAQGHGLGTLFLLECGVIVGDAHDINLTIGLSWGHTPLAPALSEANRWLAAGRGLDSGCHPGSTQFDPEKEAGP